MDKKLYEKMLIEEYTRLNLIINSLYESIDFSCSNKSQIALKKQISYIKRQIDFIEQEAKKYQISLINYASCDDDSALLGMLVGKIVEEIHIDKDDDTLTLITYDNYQFKFNHLQQCCECVTLVDYPNNYKNMINETIINGEKKINNIEVMEGIMEYTFYYFYTSTDTYCFRWNGESNGYYGVDVNIDVAKL